MSIRKPRFKSHLEITAGGDDAVFVKEEGRFHVLGSRLYPLLVPFIDGRNTLEDIARLVGDRVTVLDVEFGLDELAQSGYLLDAVDNGAATPEEGFRDALGGALSTGALTLRERLAATRV